MIEFLLLTENSTYLTALMIVLGLGVIEGVGLLIGLSAMSVLDDLFNFDVDTDATVNMEGGATALLGWLCLDKLPVLVWLVLVLTSFGLSGLTLNFVSGLTLGGFIPSLIGIPVAITSAALITSRFGRVLAKVMPKNESSAITQDSFTGRLAMITVGTAKVGQPAEAVFKDNYEQKHYVMVEPLREEESFNQGEQVVLMDKGETFWTATKYRIES